MKLLRILFLLMIGHFANAQSKSLDLNNDPVFTGIIARRIHYPFEAERAGIYAKIYAGFRIDEKGHLQDIAILNPTRIGFGLEEEVVKKLKLLPPLNMSYEGNYVLPVTFALVDYTDTRKLNSPAGRLSDEYVKGRILLNELKITGRAIPTQRGKLTAMNSGQVFIIE